MSNSQQWDIQDDGDLKDAVRAETQYDEDALSRPDLDSHVASAKRVLALQADVTQFYDDRGIAVALLGITCARAKGAVENSPVRVKDVAGQNVTFRTPDGSSLQVEQYEEMTQLGLSESEKTDRGVQNIRFTRDFLSDTSGDVTNSETIN